MKITQLLTILLVSVFLLATGCATSKPGTPQSEPKPQAATSESQMAEFDSYYDEVEALRKKADSVGGEWRDVGKFMKEARSAAGEGKFEKATRLLDQAKFQSIAGYEQALAREGAGPNY